MADKQDLKHSEARILVYLAVTDDSNCFPKAIAAKLDIGYSYLLDILAVMANKNWIGRRRSDLRSYYHINKSAPLDAAKKLLEGGKHDRKKN